MDVLTLNSLPLGYRFRPTDEELVDYYLRNKINGNENDVQVIREIDVCKWEPWDLPELSVVQSKDLEWLFFCPLDQKYPSGSRLNRATRAGYWKATGNDRKIKNRANVIGMKKTLVFYKGRAPKGIRTNWVMHEYRPTLSELDGTHPGQNVFVLCRLFKKLDESVESSQGDKVEPALSSPTATNSSPGYTQSELALDQENPALASQVEKWPTNSEKFQVKYFERRSDNIMVPVECHNHSDTAYDHAAAVTLTEVDPPQVEYGDWMSGPILDPDDCKLFSPLSTQMRAELGSSDMHHLGPNNFSNGHGGLQFQYGTNEQDAYISEFLNDSEDFYFCGDPCTLNNLAADNETPKYINLLSLDQDSVKDSRSCSESDRIVAVEEGGGRVSYHGAQFLNSICNDSEDESDYETKYINSISHYQDFVKDSRSCRELDRKVAYEEGKLDTEFGPSCFEDDNREAHAKIESTARGFRGQPMKQAQSGGLSLNETNTRAKYIPAWDSGTMRIRTRQPEDYSTSTNFDVPQGIAHRRVQMQTKLIFARSQGSKIHCGIAVDDDKEKSTVTEGGKPAENHAADASSILLRGRSVASATNLDYSHKLTPVLVNTQKKRIMRRRSSGVDLNINCCKIDFGIRADDDKEKSTVTEGKKPAENHAADAASATNVDEPQKLTPVLVITQSKTKMRARGVVLQNSDGNDPSVFAKTGVRRSILSLLSMLRNVGVIIVFCVVLAVLWRCLAY